MCLIFLLFGRYYGVTSSQVVITVTQCGDLETGEALRSRDQEQARVSLHRSTTDSRISYSATGEDSLQTLKLVEHKNLYKYIANTSLSRILFKSIKYRTTFKLHIFVTDRVETLGSTFYINKDGNINLAIVLQVI